MMWFTFQQNNLVGQGWKRRAWEGSGCKKVICVLVQNVHIWDISQSQWDLLTDQV